MSVKTIRNTLVLVGSLLLGGCSEPQHHRSPEVKQRILSSLERRISQESAQTNGRPDKYAILITGADEERYVNEIAIINQILVENGFKRENIYILDQDGKGDLYPVDNIANKKNIEAIFSHLGKKIDRKDLLVVHISGHGVRKKIKRENSDSGEYEEVTEIVLPSENVSEIDFERYLSGINPKFGLITTEICYGGGLAKRVGKGNYIGIAQTTEKDVGYSEVGDSFGGFLYQAFKNSAESDKNKDGIVTIDEAFEYAKKKHSWSRGGVVSPQLISELDVKNISIK